MKDYIKSVKEIIVSSVNKQKLSFVKAEPFAWYNEFYINTFLNMYCALINTPVVNVIKVYDTIYGEPIMLVKSKHNKSLTHIVDVPLLQRYFSESVSGKDNPIKREFAVRTYDIGNFNKSEITKYRKKVKYSDLKVFTVDEKKEEEDGACNDENLETGSWCNIVNRNLLKLYVAADHAAYHYLALQYRNDSDYGHKKMYRFDLETPLLYSLEKLIQRV